MRRWGLRERERRRRSGEGLRERLSRPNRSGIELRVSGAVRAKAAVRCVQGQAAFATRHCAGPDVKDTRGDDV